VRRPHHQPFTLVIADAEPVDCRGRGGVLVGRFDVTEELGAASDDLHAP
jgi:hypothetical protein